MTLAILIGAIALLAYLSGTTDSANVVAPIISARALSPRRALVLTAVGASAGPVVFGLAVARAFGEGVIAPDHATPAIVLAATLSALVWRGLTWWGGCRRACRMGWWAGWWGRPGWARGGRR